MSNKLFDIVSNVEGLYEGNLIHYFKLVFSAPNANNPDHNFRHMTHVLCRTYEGAKFCKYHKLFGKRRLQALLIAALWHDYGHSGKMVNDAEEIVRTISFLRALILKEDKYLLPEIESLIRLTEFPHANTVLTLGAEILRDADLSQVFSDVWIQQVIFGISKEKNIDPLKFLQDEIGFLRQIKFYSPWGKQTFYPLVQDKISEVRNLLRLVS